MAIVRRFLDLLTTLALARSAIAYGYPDCVNGPLKNNTVCNTSASPTQRAAALVAAMTIDEKLVNFVEYVFPFPALRFVSLRISRFQHLQFSGFSHHFVLR